MITRGISDENQNDDYNASDSLMAQLRFTAENITNKL